MFVIVFVYLNVMLENLVDFSGEKMWIIWREKEGGRVWNVMWFWIFHVGS